MIFETAAKMRLANEISGANAYQNGKSIHYNPYRDRGTAEDYMAWERGYLNARETNGTGHDVKKSSRSDCHTDAG